MVSEYRLREANISDLDGLFSIYMDESVNRFLNFELMDKTKFKYLLLDLFVSGQLLIFENDKQILATCLVTRQKRRSNHVATLGTLATHPQFQGQGIGTQFMKALFEKLKDNGIKRVELYVEADNPNAQQFYKKLGFQHEGILKKYFKRPYENHYVDEYIMALMLE
jgi:putative acetyltransferase